MPDFQDLLHLQLPGDGTYYVAIYPRPREEAAPAFTALDNGKIIKVVSLFGTDYAYLSLADDTATAEGVTFRGTAASVQQRAAGTAPQPEWRRIGNLEDLRPAITHRRLAADCGERNDGDAARRQPRRYIAADRPVRLETDHPARRRDADDGEKAVSVDRAARRRQPDPDEEITAHV